MERRDLGTFKTGSIGDASILSFDEGRFDYVDSTGEQLIGRERISAHGIVIDGQWREDLC